MLFIIYTSPIEAIQDPYHAPQSPASQISRTTSHIPYLKSQIIRKSGIAHSNIEKVNWQKLLLPFSIKDYNTLYHLLQVYYSDLFATVRKYSAGCFQANPQDNRGSSVSLQPFWTPLPFPSDRQRI